MAPVNLFGWDLLYNSIKDDIKNNQDVLVCLTHLVLISNGFKCIGLGDSKVLDGTETKSEVLPKGWNSNYTIRYVYQGRLYNLRGTNMDDAVMVNLIRVQERTVSMVQLNTNSVVQRIGSLDVMIPNSEELAETIQRQLVNKVVVSSKAKDGTTQTSTERSTPQPFPRPPTVDGLYNPPRAPYSESFPNPGSVGRSDLDPFGMGSNPLGMGRPPPGFLPGGGGMLFVPPGPPRFGSNPSLGVPGGSLPPGARFDPFRPPEADIFNPRPNRPDNDEMPPPGFDDMYM